MGKRERRGGDKGGNKESSAWWHSLFFTFFRFLIPGGEEKGGRSVEGGKKGRLHEHSTIPHALPCHPQRKEKGERKKKEE